MVPLNVFTLHMSKPSGTGDFGESDMDVVVVVSCTSHDPSFNLAASVPISLTSSLSLPPTRFRSNRTYRQSKEQQDLCQ